jgi:hypothetical protein
MPAARKSRLQSIVLGIALGSLAAIAMTLVVWRLMQPAVAPTLTQADLDAAVRRWQASGPKNYRMDVEVAGKRSGQVHIEVHDGEPTAMTRDGRTPPSRVWHYWTVEGLFDDLEQELSAARDPARSYGAAPDAHVIQRVQFDERLGYPVEYQRDVLGVDQAMGWRVTKFEPL